MSLKEGEGEVIVDIRLQRTEFDRLFEVLLRQLVVLETHIDETHTEQGVRVFGVGCGLFFEQRDILVRYLLTETQGVNGFFLLDLIDGAALGTGECTFRQRVFTFLAT